MTADLVTASDLAYTDAKAATWVSAQVRAYCGWHIAPSVTEDLVLDADGGSLLLLPSLHVTDVTQVALRDGTTYAADTDPLLADVMEWSAVGMLRRTDCVQWPTAYRSVTVSLVHGYAATPPEIVEVCASAAKRMPAQMAAVTREAADGVMRMYGGDLGGGFGASGWTFAEQTVLDKYRLGNRP